MSKQNKKISKQDEKAPLPAKRGFFILTRPIFSVDLGPGNLV
jgi:hypothetical protein